MIRIPHLKLSAKQFIDYVNRHFDDHKRNRILLAEVLLKLERIEKELQNDK